MGYCLTAIFRFLTSLDSKISSDKTPKWIIKYIRNLMNITKNGIVENGEILRIKIMTIINIYIVILS